MLFVWGGSGSFQEIVRRWEHCSAKRCSSCNVRIANGEGCTAMKNQIRYFLGRAVLGASILFLTALLGAGQAWAESQGELVGALRGLDWDVRKGEVLKSFKTELEGEFKETASQLRDPVKKERLRRRMLDNFEKIEESYVQLKGKRTGFEVSVIAGEYSTKNNESLLIVRDEYAQRYYLFADGRLWKMIIAYNPEYIQDVGFEAFTEQVARKYGAPVDNQYQENSGEQILSSVIWRDEVTELRIEDKSEFFNTFTMVFSNLEKAQRFEKFRRAFGERKKKDSLGFDLADLQNEGEYDEGGDDVVDSITGVKTEVVLNDELFKDERARRVGGAATVADANLPQEKAKKRKRAKKRKKAKKKKSKGLIIY